MGSKLQKKKLTRDEVWNFWTVRFRFEKFSKYHAGSDFYNFSYHEAATLKSSGPKPVGKRDGALSPPSLTLTGFLASLFSWRNASWSFIGWKLHILVNLFGSLQKTQEMTPTLGLTPLQPQVLIHPEPKQDHEYTKSVNSTLNSCQLPSKLWKLAKKRRS